MNMYYIAIVAPEEINTPVLQWKQLMYEKFRCTAALKSPAHITLIPPFRMHTGLEDDLIRSIREFSQQQTAFLLQLENFDVFKPKVIFVHVVSNEKLDKLFNSFEDFLLAKNIFPVKKDTRPFHPHVTIAARDLHKRAFYEAWKIFERKKYEAIWPVQGLSLLRHNKKNWDVIFTSQFPV